jgi:hypothetical protein
MTTDKVKKPSKADDMLQKYLDKAAELFKPTPMPTYEAPKVEPIRFSNKDTVSVNALAADILTVLEGHTIQEIMTASNIAEQFVMAQSKGQFFTYMPPMRSV